MLLHGNCITFFVSLRTVVLIHHKLKCTSCIYCYKFISIMADSDKRLIGDGSQNISNRNPYNPNILPAAPESLRPETQTHYISANDALVQKKKPTSFQITSVTVQGSRLSTDGGEDSADDLDESHTEDISSDILDCSRTTDIDNDQLSEDNSNANNDDLLNLGLPIPIKCISDCQIKRDVQVSKIPSEPIVNVKSNVEVKINTTSNLITSEPPSVKTPTLPDQWQHRFKVVKIISSEPFKRGRWLCMDFMDPPNVQSSEVKPETSESLAGSSALLEGGDRTTSSGLPVNRLAHIYEISPNESYPGSVSVTVSPQQVHQPLYGIYLPINNQMPDMATMPAMFAQNPRLDTIQKPKSSVALQQSTSFTTQPMQQQSFVASTMQQPQSFISNNQAFEDKPMTQQNFTSQPQQNFTSQPQQTFTPQPQQTFTPQPQQTFTPQPQQTFMPQPQQTFTPQPQQTFTPQPQQTFTPQPQQTFTPQPPQSQAMPSVPVQQQQLTMQHTTSSNSLTGQTQAQTTVGAGTVPEGMLMQSSQHQVVSSTATVPMVMSQPQVMQDVHIPTSHSQATQKTSQVLPNHSSQNLHLQSMTPVSSAPTVISSASQANLAQMPSSCLQNQPSQLHQVSSVPLNIAPVTPLQTSIAPSIPDISSTNAHLVANQEVYNVPSQVSQNHIDTSDHGTPPAVISQSLVEVLPDALVTKTITIITNSEESTESAPSGSNTVAIDNKIEQAMDLVKSHLMFAVREEVDVLKEKITELMERISQLEYENSFLKANASHETLEQLNQSQQLQQQQTQNAAVSINPLQPLQQSIQNQQPTS